MSMENIMLYIYVYITIPIYYEEQPLRTSLPISRPQEQPPRTSFGIENS